MALSEQQQAARLGKMTGSRIGTLTTGNTEDVYNLWLELTGDPDYKPPDYSDDFGVQLGNATEQFHLDWIQRHCGEIDCRGNSLQHKDIDWALVTLDGWAKRDGVPVEAKHVGGYESADTVLDRYMPQMHWTMWCAGTNEIIFSAINGTKEPRPVFIGLDQAYLDTLIEAATRFMACVRDLREPVPNPFVKAPKPIFTRVVDMSGSNSWGVMAAQWKEHKVSAGLYQSAAKGLKELVPADAKECFGAGIRAKRSKNGALTIKLENDDDEAKAEE